MLEPSQRLTYLDELRPPAGYRLDYAVTTTFTLDLMALLIAPFSMALMEQREKDGSRSPLALLAALRKTASRLAVFCDRGRISVPKKDQLLYSYLEDSVVETVSPGGGAFHPKIWALRFCCDEQPTFYRFLCLSRNLTFDRSWDTALALEGYVKDQAINRLARNEPLSKFVAMLPDFAVSQVSDHIRSNVSIVADELRRVDFEVPDLFYDKQRSRDLVFMPMGTDRHQDVPSFACAKKLLVVSPFLSEGWLKDVLEEVPGMTIISRPDALDALSNGFSQRLVDDGVRIYTLDEAAEHPEELAEDDGSNCANETASEPEETASNDEHPDVSLHGLHAKLFVAEFNAGWVDVWTGSANATNAAFGSGNVEFLVGLNGKRRDVGIDQMLRQDESGASATSFGHLLSPYVRQEVRDPDAALQQEIEQQLEDYRAAVLGTDIQLQAKLAESGTYDLALVCPDTPPPVAGVTVTCRPVTLPAAAAMVLYSADEGSRPVFRALPASALTRFIAFRLEINRSGKSASLGFVLKLDASGFPEDRDSRVLETIIQDAEQFMNYLILLLSDCDDAAAFDWGQSQEGTKPHSPPTQGDRWDALPLFESLVRAFSRRPDELSQIAELVDDMRKFKSNILPIEFEQLWDTIYKTHKKRSQA